MQSAEARVERLERLERAVQAILNDSHAKSDLLYAMRASVEGPAEVQWIDPTLLQQFDVVPSSLPQLLP